jgi:hypothetical protein
MKGVNFSCLKISNIPYNSIFTQNFHDSSILISIISGAYLNLFVRMNARLYYSWNQRLVLSLILKLIAMKWKTVGIDYH